jgi:hypothetical protein
MSETDLIHLYQDLTASSEMLARSVVMFVQSGLGSAAPATEPDEAAPASEPPGSRPGPLPALENRRRFPAVGQVAPDG